ncbi:MAG TPA: sialidase family protein [Thermoplasmata archaeon]|nr:sialidase family protein [Thermoplasmata archaeon]
MRSGRASRTAIGTISFGLAAVIVLSIVSGAGSPLTTPMVMGYPPGGDDWEPAAASDGAGNVYYLTTHFGGVPGCGGCADPTIVVQVSHDSGRTFDAPRPLTVSSSTQYDPQVKINAAGTVFVSYLLGKDTVVQRSTDLGATWSAPVAVNADVKQGPTDKDGLAVQGNDVYVGFDVAQKFFVSASHDGGLTFVTTQINQNTLGWPLNGGATVAPDGTVYMVWELVHKSGQAQGPQDVLVTMSTDKGVSWSLSYADTGLPPGPGCLGCGWDFLGTGAAIATDQGGNVYVTYNAPLYNNGPPHVWYRSSTDGGATWSSRIDLSTDGTPSFHVFPGVAAGIAGDVRVAWIDNRTGAFNLWYRTSSDGGRTWSSEIKVSAFRSGYAYVTRQGFAFPYGDYITLALDPKGTAHLAWGEGPDYTGPGNTLYAHS